MLRRNILIAFLLTSILFSGCTVSDSTSIEPVSVIVENVSENVPEIEDNISTVNGTEYEIATDAMAQDYTGNNLYSSIIAQENEFYDIISNNPIDRNFVWNGGIASEIRISKATEYRDLWNAEIEHTLAILKEYLTEEDYEILQHAHEDWMQYMSNIMCVEEHIFYVGMNYGVGDNGTYPLVMEAVVARTKEYAIELMALEYAFTRTVEFVAE